MNYQERKQAEALAYEMGETVAKEYVQDENAALFNRAIVPLFDLPWPIMLAVLWARRQTASPDEFFTKLPDKQELSVRAGHYAMLADMLEKVPQKWLVRHARRWLLARLGAVVIHGAVGYIGGGLFKKS